MEPDDLGGPTTIASVERSRARPVVVDHQSRPDDVRATKVLSEGHEIRDVGRRHEDDVAAVAAVFVQRLDGVVAQPRRRHVRREVPAGDVDVVGRTAGEHHIRRDRLDPVSVATHQRRHQLGQAAAESGDQAAGSGDTPQEWHHTVTCRQRAVDVESDDGWPNGHGSHPASPPRATRHLP